MTALPSKANIVVIGGGLIGCSTAYHLAKRGVTDVVVLEKGKLTSGSTWHAAGMVGQLRSSANITQLLRNSVELYGRLEAETGQATGWRATGSLRLCCTEDRRIEYQRAITTAHSFNLEIEMLTPAEIEKLCPGINVSDVLCGVYVPSDGMVNPSDLTMSLAKGARSGGVKFFEGIAVTGLETRDGRIAGVKTEQGAIQCDAVVLCAGLWSRELARRVGVNIPILASHHHYIVTEKIEGLSRDMPGLRDPDNLTYFKEEVGGLIAGGYEPNPIPYAGRPERNDPDFRLFPEEVEHFEQLMTGMVKRFPVLERVGIKQWFNGLESFTEDTNFILGETPEVRNCSSAADSIPWASPPAAAQGWRWPIGWPRASRPTISGRWISGAFPNSTAPTAPYSCARWRGRAITTPWAGRTMNSKPAGRCGGARSMTGCLQQGACFGAQVGLGTAELVRARGRRGEGRLQLRPRQLVFPCGRGA